MMRIAVLGAGGFIGNRIAEMLTLLGLAEVRPVVRRAQSLAMSSRLALDGRLADGRDIDALQRAVTGCDAVVHAIAGDPATIVGTVEPVYRAAAAAGVARLVYLSSASVHGQAPVPETTEQSPLSTRQPIAYNNAKVRAERRLGALRAVGPTELVILRPGIVHGPRSQWIAGFADDLVAGRAILVRGGRGICNGIYVDNLVHAIWLALNVPAADRRTYLVGDAETFTWAELYRPIAWALGHALDDLPAARPAGPESVARRFWRGRSGHWVRRGVPPPLRAALGAAYRSARSSASPGVGVPTASLETTLLQRCSVKLPHDRAAAELGYVPPISLETATARTLSWLDFAGYPVRLPPIEKEKGEVLGVGETN